MLHDKDKEMSDDVVVKALTGLMFQQKGMLEAHERLSEQQDVLVESQKAIFTALERQSTAFHLQGKDLKKLGTAMREQFLIMEDLKRAMEQFADTSTDTRKRLATVEETLSKVVSDVEDLKNAS